MASLIIDYLSASKQMTNEIVASSNFHVHIARIAHTIVLWHATKIALYRGLKVHRVLFLCGHRKDQRCQR